MGDSISIGAAYRDQDISGATSLDATTVTGTTVNVTALTHASGGTVGFYGITPIAQRAYSSAVHATSALATSTDFGATQLAALQEVQNTLIALGVWATA